jgi:hypothetical protein
LFQADVPLLPAHRKAVHVTSKLMSSHSLSYNVTDRQSFINFLEKFHQDLLNNKQDWENKTLEDFLEALTRYAEDITGYYENTKQNVNADAASWQVFADMLQGAKVYE